MSPDELHLHMFFVVLYLPANELLHQGLIRPFFNGRPSLLLLWDHMLTIIAGTTHMLSAARPSP